uniref:Uncharacterized protein n=1 Tax=Oryza brachyantha TaxID=4533 RepID=J3MSM8_ORYBR
MFVFTRPTLEQVLVVIANMIHWSLLTEEQVKGTDSLLLTSPLKNLSAEEQYWKCEFDFSVKTWLNKHGKQLLFFFSCRLERDHIDEYGWSDGDDFPP